MKKLAILLIVSIMLLSLCGCGDDREDYKCVSKIENVYLVGESENFILKLTGGESESPSIMDGVAGKLTSYGKLTLKVKSGYAEKYSYQIGISEEGFSGDFKEEIIGGNLHAEIKVSEIPDREYKVIISFADKTEEVVISSKIPDEAIKWKEAKAIAKKQLSQNILEMQSEKAEDYECYIKYLYDEEKSQGSWYVSFASEEKMCAVLIDAKTKKILAKRV